MLPPAVIPLDVLLLEDRLEDADLVLRALRRGGYAVKHRRAATEAEFIAALKVPPEVVLADYALPDFDALRALALLQERGLVAPFIVVTASLRDEEAANCIRLGADDFLLKDRLGRLPDAVRQAQDKYRLRAERELVQSALRESERLKAAIISASLDCLITVDVEGNIVDFNPAAESTFGYRRTAVLGKSMAELVIPHGLRDAHNRGFARALETGEHRLLGKRLEVRGLRANGTEFPVELTITATGTRQVPLFTGYLRDISDRIQHERALRESEERFRSFMGHLPGCASIRDVDGRYTYVNEAWQRDFAVASAAVLGKTAQEVFASEHGAEADAAHRQVLETRLPQSRLFSFGPDGKERWWLAHHFPITDASGRTVLVGTIASDVTEQKNQEERINRLNRIHAVLSSINSAIVHIDDRQKLLEKACSIAIDPGGFGIAWIGEFDARTLEIIPVATAGYGGEGNLQLGKQRGVGNGVKARAIRERKPVFSNDLGTEQSAGGAHREEAIRRGYRSLIALPLIVDDAVVGIFSMFAKEANFFDDDELELLTELARNISFALENIDREEKIRRLTRIQSVTSGINSLIVRVRNRQELLTEVCRIAVEHGNFGIAWTGLLDPETFDVVPIASSGLEDNEFLRGVESSARPDHPRGQGVVGQAVRSRKPVFANELSSQTAIGRRAREAIRRGYHSRIALPLLVGMDVVGVIVLFAVEPNFFNEEELKLLTELADNVSFALEHLARTEDLKLAHLAVAQERELLVQRVAERTRDLEAAKAESEQANRAKSDFLAAMSHEIRTPMNGIIGMVEILAESGLPEDQFDAVRTIRDSAFTLLRIIDDILDFSKIEAGRLELERVPVSVADLVEGICVSLGSTAAGKSTELRVYVSPKLPAQVWSDPTRLRQVIYNLVGNAIKFSDDRSRQKGPVSVTVDVAGADGAAPLLLEFRIADHGIGMAPDTLKKLFAPFTQAETSTRRRFGGTGLGLVISRRLVSLMGGEIHVESALGVGSTFTVRLPFDAVSGATQPPVSDLAALQCILVADDDGVAADLASYLEHAGAEVRRAASSASAGRMATEAMAPVVVVQDLRRERSAVDALPAESVAAPNVRQLLLTRGRRRRARVTAPDQVILDAEILERVALVHAVAVAAGRASPDTFRDNTVRVPQDAAPPTLSEARAQGRLILIAEDDETNQKVILRQLALLGYAAEVTTNGVEALQLWRGGGYALVLTDLHMAEMDGYALAEAIRREEALAGGTARRIPILALTANALRGEASRALAAGMDEYLTKPVQLRTLQAALEQWLPQRSAAAPGASPPPAGSEDAAPVLDVAVLKSLVGDDMGTVCELLNDYAASARKQVVELSTASAAGDARAVGAVAHKLKSSSRSVGAIALGTLCAELDRAGKAGEQSQIVQLMPQLLALSRKTEERIARVLVESGRQMGA